MIDGNIFFTGFVGEADLGVVTRGVAGGAAIAGSGAGTEFGRTIESTEGMAGDVSRTTCGSTIVVFAGAANTGAFIVAIPLLQPTHDCEAAGAGM